MTIFPTKHSPYSLLDRKQQVPEAFIVPSIVKISRILEINRPNCQTWSDQDKARIVLRYKFIHSCLSDNSYRKYQTHLGLLAYLAFYVNCICCLSARLVVFSPIGLLCFFLAFCLSASLVLIFRTRRTLHLELCAWRFLSACNNFHSLLTWCCLFMRLSAMFRIFYLLPSDSAYRHV